MQQPEMASNHLSKITRIVIREGWRSVVMDNDRALHGDRKVLIRGEGDGDVLPAYIERRKASRGDHT